MQIKAARRAIGELIVEVWKRAGSLDELDAYTEGYIEALKKALKAIGGVPPRVRKCGLHECLNVIAQSGSGRTRQYCSDYCRQKAHRKKKADMKGTDD